LIEIANLTIIRLFALKNDAKAEKKGLKMKMLAVSDEKTSIKKKMKIKDEKLLNNINLSNFLMSL